MLKDVFLGHPSFLHRYAISRTYGGVQTKLLDYLKRKSPKDMKARERLKQESEAEPTKLQGTLKSPLSGDLIHPGPQNQPSEGPGPVPVARGGVWGVGGRKKALKALERMPPALKASPGGLGKSRPSKRTMDTQGGRESKSRKVVKTEGRKQVTLEKWISKEVKGCEGHPPDPGGTRTGSGGQENQRV